jgi:hypothetical protein
MRCLLVVVLAFLFVPASSALAAGTYTVDTCSTASGGAATSDGWTTNTQTATAVTNSCPVSGIVISRSGDPSAGARGEIAFAPPAGTRVTGLRLWRSFGLTQSWGYGLDVDGARLESCDSSCPSGSPINSSPDLSVANGDFRSVVLFAECAPGGCSAAAGPLVSMRRLQVDVADDTDPAFTSTPSGDLLDTARPLSGVRSLSFAAADSGSGVFLAYLEIDGQRVVGNTVDPNGGRCAKPFTSFAPCRGSAAGSFAVDTAKLADGGHSVRVIVTDATETNAVAYGPVQVTTANTRPPDPGAPVTAACARAVPAGLTARFLTTKKTTLTRKGGGAFTLAGTAPAGAALTLQSLETRTGAGWVTAATGVAAADGTFRLGVPAGPSRRLRVAYRSSPAATELSCSNVLVLKVPARVTLSAKRASARRYRLTGRLLVPTRGKVVELQAYERGKWRTFGSARSSASGRFSYRYTFRAESRGRTFRMRARVRADASYPFALGYSKVIRVRVR